MKSLLYLTSCIAASLAAPASWSYEMAAFYSEVNANVLEARSSHPNKINPPNCDLSKVDIIAYLKTIPDAPSPIVDPGNAKLVQVTIGRGIQNYTCADNKDTTKPVAIGAIANLYNVSCIAANYPRLLSLLSPFAVQYNTSLDAKGKMMWTRWERSGHHYFNAQKSPTFDLNDDPNHKLGVINADGANPDMRINAPVSAVKGQVGTANGDKGAVPWLKLKALSTSDPSGPTHVYRVDTAGGTAPSSCAGQPSLISVEYAAQYWFYKA